MKGEPLYKGCIAVIIAAIELARADSIEPKGCRRGPAKQYWKADAQAFLVALAEERSALEQDAPLFINQRPAARLRWKYE